MTVIIQRRHEQEGFGAEAHVAYEYERAYRVGDRVIGVDPIDPSAGLEDYVREFMDHSIDELIYETIEDATMEDLMADVGIEVPESEEWYANEPIYKLS